MIFIYSFCRKEIFSIFMPGALYKLSHRVRFHVWHVLPRVQTEVPFAGDSLERYLSFTTDRPHNHRMPPPAGDNYGWVVFDVRTGFALGHRASTFRACAHLMKTAARYQLRAPRSIFVPGTQHVWWGRGDKSRRASTRCDCRGKSR